MVKVDVEVEAVVVVVVDVDEKAVTVVVSDVVMDFVVVS